MDNGEDEPLARWMMDVWRMMMMVASRSRMGGEVMNR